MMVEMLMFIALQPSDMSGLGLSESILILRSEVSQVDRLHASCDDRLSFLQIFINRYSDPDPLSITEHESIRC